MAGHFRLRTHAAAFGDVTPAQPITSFGSTSSTLLDSASPASPRTLRADLAPSTSTSSNLNSHLPRTFSPSPRQAANSSESARPSLGMLAQADQVEATCSVLVWHVTRAAPSALSKTPIIREVPQVKRKLAKRDSQHQSIIDPEPSEGSSPLEKTSSGGFAGLSLKGAAPSWLRERPSRNQLAATKPQLAAKGGWKKGTVLFRSDGVLSIFGEDRALLHSIVVPRLSVGDVRIVEDSVFGRANVLGIFSKPSLFSASARPQSPPVSGEGEGSPAPSQDEPIYLCFTTSHRLRRWRALLRIHATPEIYGSASSLARGGTHRIYNEVDLTIIEARSAARSLWDASETLQQHGASSGIPHAVFADPDDDDEPVSGEAAPAVVIGDGAGVSSADRPRRSMSASSTATSTGGEDEGGRTSRLSSAHGSSTEVHLVSGPISGVAGGARQAEASGPYSGRASTAGSSRFRSTPVNPESYGPRVRGGTARSILVLHGPHVVAQTKMRTAVQGSVVWMEKFSLQDLPELRGLRIEMVQGHKNGKTGLLGVVDLPIETMRRGEDIEGWWPIWSAAAGEVPSGGDGANAASAAATSSSAAHQPRRVVGEVKLTVKVREEYVMALSRYAAVERALNGEACVQLARGLAKELDEDQVISHLVDVWTSTQTIAERLSDLALAESGVYGERLEPELLFRANTLLSRSLDKFQRIYCRDWLDASIGDVVRRICSDKIWLDEMEPVEPIMMGSGVRSGTSSLTPAGEHSAVDTLRKLSFELWQGIYDNRHHCPLDLRRSLSCIRRTVNSAFRNTPGPGIQGVGAFVFLRLICPAITAPHLYGLMAASPDARSKRTLMLVAKIFLALANKKTGFDRDKEPWLSQTDDFLRSQAAAYDDFIVAVSTEPAAASQRVWPLGDDADPHFQRVLASRLGRLATIHRESMPTSPYLTDRALALASFVSYVVRGAQSREMEGGNLVSGGAAAALALSPTHDAGGGAASAAEAAVQALVEERLDDLVEACCQIEEKAGDYFERCGARPTPLPIPANMAGQGAKRRDLGASTVTVVGRLSTPPPAGEGSSGGSPSGSISNGGGGNGSMRSRSRRATVSVVPSPPPTAVSDWDDAGRGPIDSVIGGDSFLKGRVSGLGILGGQGGRRPSAGPGLPTASPRRDVSGSGSFGSTLSRLSPSPSASTLTPSSSVGAAMTSSVIVGGGAARQPSVSKPRSPGSSRRHSSDFVRLARGGDAGERSVSDGRSVSRRG